MKRTSCRSLLVACLLVNFSVATAFGRDLAERFEAAESEGVTAQRTSTAIYFNIDADVKSPITIPRIAAPLRITSFMDPAIDGDIQVVPKQDHWQIHWDGQPGGDPITIWLSFGNKPLLVSEIEAVKASTDGSFYLPAHVAKTTGENIRYEPQPHKNTVGYWTGKNDSATWPIKLDKPGRFNVAVLQGCGKGQGGSTASMTFQRHDKDEPDATLDFEVVETGHFQNFQWVQLGEVELQHAGEVQVVVAPKQIKKAALMDIRAIHLIRLPDKQ